MNARSLIVAIALLAGASAAAAQGRVTAHVLDLYSGTAASGLKIELFVQESGSFKLVKSAITNADGRPPEGPLLTPQTIKPGRYQAVAHIGDYYKSIGTKLPSGYHTKLIIEFEIYDAKAPHHLPFQITPWTQSTSVLPG